MHPVHASSADECARRCPEYAAATERITVELERLRTCPIPLLNPMIEKVKAMIEARNAAWVASRGKRDVTVRHA